MKLTTRLLDAPGAPHQRLPERQSVPACRGGATAGRWRFQIVKRSLSGRSAELLEARRQRSGE